MTQEALKLAHWSDCAVHREPAYPNGECDCGGIVTVADYTALSDKYVALSDKYVALKAQPKQEPVAIKRMKEWIEYLKRKSDFGQHIFDVERAISLLQERRTALISAAVTGQIDVRGFEPVAA